MTRTLEDKISEPENKHFQAGWQAALDFMKNREEKINKSVSGKEDVKLPEVGKIKAGLYKVFWKSGGDSLASVGYGRDGKAWIAPTNWVWMQYFDDVIDRIEEMQSIIKDGVELPEDNIEKLEIYHCKQCKKIIPNELAEGGAVTICSEECWNIFRGRHNF